MIIVTILQFNLYSSGWELLSCLNLWSCEICNAWWARKKLQLRYGFIPSSCSINKSVNDRVWLALQVKAQKKRDLLDLLAESTTATSAIIAPM